MISFFNENGNTWIAKAIFAALGISMMAFWGLGGIGNTSGSDTTAIQVGSKKISMYELNKAFDVERAKLSQLTAQYISPKKALEMGLLEQVVQKQVAESLAEAIQEDLGLSASDEAVRKYVERHPVFKDTLGNFDRNLFMAYLAQTHMTEGQLAEQLRKELATQHFSNTIRFVTPASQILAEMMWKRQNELRDIEALLIETDKIPLSTQPSKDELKDYYEAYLSDFMIPETRDIILLNLSPENVAKTIQVSQERINEFYEVQKDTYATPERRHIYQMRFNTQETAEKARKDLTAQNFVSKAGEKGQTMAETDFGTVAKTELLSELADVAFSAPKNTVLGPIETPVGWHLILVTEIQSEVKPDKVKVYADIKKKLIADETYAKLEEMARSLEDFLGEGVPLAEAASRLGLATQSFKKVDISAASLPEQFKNNELTQNLFTLKEKETTALVEHSDGYLIAEVTQIHPVQAKTFEEVQPELKKLWRQEQQKTLLEDLTKKALDQMKKGSIPAKYGQLIVAKKVSQKGVDSLPNVAMPKIFLQNVGYENAQAIMLPNGVLITIVKNIQTPSVDVKALPDQKEQISAENAETIYNGVVASYAEKLGVKINADAIKKTFDVYQTE